MSEGIRGLVVAHSTLAVGMAAAVRQIAGVDEEALQPISNEGCGPEGIVAAIGAAAGESPVIIFTDMGSGSCAFAARKIAGMRPNTGVICGVNLSLLLDFVFHRDMPLSELVDRLVEKGRSGITGACSEEAANADRAAAR